MAQFNSRAALVAAMLILPGASAKALTCAEDPARAETLAREATAIILGRVTALPLADPPPAPTIPKGPTITEGAPAPIPDTLRGFLTPEVERELEIEAIEVLKGEVPKGVFRAHFLEGPCTPLPAEGKRRILYLRHDGDGWRVLGSN